jgi:hypothetical protein
VKPVTDEPVRNLSQFPTVLAVINGNERGLPLEPRGSDKVDPVFLAVQLAFVFVPFLHSFQPATQFNCIYAKQPSSPWPAEKQEWEAKEQRGAAKPSP